jgi:hypothetical protein
MDSEGGLGSSVGYQLKRAQHALRLEMDGALRGVGLTTPRYAGCRGRRWRGGALSRPRR